MGRRVGPHSRARGDSKTIFVALSADRLSALVASSAAFNIFLKAERPALFSVLVSSPRLHRTRLSPSTLDPDSERRTPLSFFSKVSEMVRVLVETDVEALELLVVEDAMMQLGERKCSVLCL